MGNEGTDKSVMEDAVRKPNGLGKLGRFIYKSERESRNIDTQGTDSGSRWIRNQQRSEEDWRRRSSGQNPASTRRLGIGEVRKAPVAKRTPA